MTKYSIAVHGGAGTILKSLMTLQNELVHQQGLAEAVLKAEALLKAGGTALDAVEIAVRSLENNELYNAGKGSVFTSKGTHEMDACIMDGYSLTCGAVTGVSNIKNPVSLARLVMEKSDHVLLSGPGAIEFAKRLNAEFADDSYFFSQMRYDQLLKARETGQVILDHTEDDFIKNRKFGTVGAVAMDQHGNLAAATSTGGMTNKMPGRIGDSPIPGIGTYANNKTCAVSCTGHGELFMKAVVAYDISCLMEYRGLSLKEACELVVMDKLVKIGGEGGLIAVDATGAIEMPFNSEGMYRAMKTHDSALQIGIYSDVIQE